MNKKILITGVAGFIGGHLASNILENYSHDVFGVDDLSGGFLRNVPENCKFTKLDLREREAVRVYVESLKPDIIFHLAADATEGRSQFTPINCTERNYLAYLNLLVPAVNNGLERIILTSSMSVYGSQKPPFSEELSLRPDDVYGIAKTAMEQATKVLAKVHDFNYVIVRPHNVYGPQQNLADPYRNVVAIFINSMLRDKNFYIYGDGEQQRAFTYIDDFIPYFAKTAFAENMVNEALNLGSERTYSVNDLANAVLESFGYSMETVPEHLAPEYLPERPQEVKMAYCSEKKARELLDFEPEVDLQEGVRRTLEWAKRLGPQQPCYMESLEIENDMTPSSWTEKLI